MKKIKVEDAVGMALAHDVTEITRGCFKGRAFSKGHVIRKSDLDHLKRLGKHHIYALEIKPGHIHEDEAAELLADAFCGENVGYSDGPAEGKIMLEAQVDGILKVDIKALERINMLGDVMCATRHTNSLVRKGQAVAGTRAIPLTIDSGVVDQAVSIASECNGILEVKAMRAAHAGIVITGNEVYEGVIKDEFEPILRRKLDNLGCTVAGAEFAPDNEKIIGESIGRLLEQGADLILTTGGMSVDPDDVTRMGISLAADSVKTYGTPVLPGAMFLIARAGDVPILGIPACGIFHEATVLDLLLPRVLAGEQIGRKEVAALGHGGLCLNCKKCRYPDCPFGKG